MIRPMRYASISFWTIATCCLVSPGCTVCQNAKRTVCDEPAAYSWKHDRRRSIEAYRQLADEAWIETIAVCPDLHGAADYGAGFRDGFVDYIYAGGTGEPPPVPPRHFWNAMMCTPDGKGRADQWFAGYRHGARVARDGGYREFGTVDSSLVAMHPAMAGPFPTHVPAFSAPIEQQRPGEESLPEPFIPPPLSARQTTPEQLPIHDNASENEAAALPAEPRDAGDAFLDDPIDESAVPAVEPPSNDAQPSDIQQSDDFSSVDETVSRAIATEEENATPSVILMSAKQPEADVVLRATQQGIESHAHSIVRFVTSDTAMDAPMAIHSNTKRHSPTKLTLNHLRGQQSATLEPTAGANQASSQHEWAPAKGTTIRIQERSTPPPAAPASGFVPFGVTFDH